MKAAHFALAAGFPLLVFADAAHAAAYLHDQSHGQLNLNAALSSAVAAADFTIGGATRVQFVDVWIADGAINDNGALDHFDGTLSWAIHQDAAGNPGALVASGNDIAVAFEDAGFNALVGGQSVDVARARVDLDGRASLVPGVHWLVLHEGIWGSPTDGDEVHWLGASGVLGSPARAATDEVNPASWQNLGFDLAFTLSGTAEGWTQRPRLDGGASAISNAVVANDFEFAGGQPGAFEVWLTDDGFNDNGQLENFTGILGWAIYDTLVDEPGSLIGSGTDFAPLLLDTGVNDVLGGDVVSARVEITGLPDLAPGDYWLAIREGEWLTPGDGTAVYWLQSVSSSLWPHKFNPDETDPEPPVDSWIAGPGDTAFSIFTELLFASGFESGRTCAWSKASAGAVCP